MWTAVFSAKLAKLRQQFWLLYVRLRFKHVEGRVMAIDGGVVSEEAYYDGNGNLIGYWAHGAWDPKMPYRGQDAVRA